MALYIPRSIFHLAWLLYVRPETFGPYYVYLYFSEKSGKLEYCNQILCSIYLFLEI